MKRNLTVTQWILVLVFLFPVAIYLAVKDYYEYITREKVKWN